MFRKTFDGKTIFGKNKTFRGFLAGLFTGTAVGFIESKFFWIFSFFRSDFYP
jgi:hypothetical protein